jgi:spermidine synthase
VDERQSELSETFEELDYQHTPLGELSLRRRRVVSLGGTFVYEVKIGNDLLMSSLVNASEIALAELALANRAGAPCDVLVGGLGLGHTAAAALDHPFVRSVTVAEYLEPVLDWHRRGIVPLGGRLCDDARCHFVHGDFFAIIRAGRLYGEDSGGETARGNSGEVCGGEGESKRGGNDEATRDGGDLDRRADGPARFDVMLVDIDHSPACLLDASHAAFYEREGLAAAANMLRPGGTLAVWSADPADAAFTDRLKEVFDQVDAREVAFWNPLLNHKDRNCVYLAQVK